MVGLSSLIVFLSLLTITNVGTNYQTSVYGDVYDYIQMSDTTYGQSHLSDCDTNTCKIGYEDMVMGTVRFTRFHNPVICVSVPAYSVTDIENVSLNVKRISGNIPCVSAYYILDNDGMLTTEDYYSKNFIGFFNVVDSTFSIDITEAVKNARRSYETNIYISLSSTGQYGGYGELYVSNDQSANSPKTIIESSAAVSENNYGSFVYNQIYPGDINTQSINCYGYALGLNIDASFSFFSGEEYSNETYCNIIKNLTKDMVKRGVHPRIIESYDSPIFSFERRIAFRVGIKNGKITDFHFMKQCWNGQWCDKMRTSTSTLYPEGENPETIQWQTLYSSEIIYFAISG